MQEILGHRDDPFALSLPKSAVYRGCDILLDCAPFRWKGAGQPQILALLVSRATRRPVSVGHRTAVAVHVAGCQITSGSLPNQLLGDCDHEQ